MGNPINKLLREPLLHFLVLGAVIFLAYTFLSKRISNEPGKIIITQGQIVAMRDAFISTFQRLPTYGEVEGLIRDRVREEVYYREALALGLDKDDIIIRRRLRQKMEFIASDVAAQDEPSDAELSDFMIKNQGLFHVDPQYTFRQVYLNAERRGNTLKQDVNRLLIDLNRKNSNEDFRKLSDATLLPSEMVDAGATEVTSQFGEEFTKQLTQLPKGKWIGPVSSGYGIHLVWIGERTEGVTPALALVHDAVRREWDDAHRLETNEKFYQELLKNYKVAIEPPEKATVKNDAQLMK